MEADQKEVLIFIFLFCPILVIIIQVLCAIIFIEFCLFAFPVTFIDLSLSMTFLGLMPYVFYWGISIPSCTCYMWSPRIYL